MVGDFFCVKLKYLLPAINIVGVVCSDGILFAKKEIVVLKFI